MATSENGPSMMYKLKPFYDTSEVIETPTCMYKLPNLYGNGEMGSGSVETGDALADLERRQETILKKLEALSKQVDLLSKKAPAASTPSAVHSSAAQQVLPALEKLSGVIRDVVISASPSQPPLSALVLSHLLSQQYRILHACHTHSSVRDVPTKLTQAFSSSGDTLARSSYQLAVTLIWKTVSHGPTLMVSPHKQAVIQGEACVARYLARLLAPSYEDNISSACEIDTWLDLSNVFSQGNKKDKAAVLKTMNSKLGQSSWLVGNELSLADIVLWSTLHGSKETSNAPYNVKKWILNCNNHAAFQTALKAL